MAASTGNLGQADYAEAAAECDVIMKGGITSGVIYPLAICELATRYRLHNVGGGDCGGGRRGGRAWPSSAPGRSGIPGRWLWSAG
jgi:hypothetical protein